MVRAIPIVLRRLITVPRYPASNAKIIPKMPAVASKTGEAGACGSTCVRRNMRYDGTAKIRYPMMIPAMTRSINLLVPPLRGSVFSRGTSRHG